MNMISEPTLLLDEAKAKANIDKMVLKANASNVELRPHFKTHQSRAIGEWYREHGVTGITVSSLKMAEYFAETGWKDITVAFPVNVNARERILRLTKAIELRVLVTNKTSLEILDRMLEHPIGVYIELDPGYGRSGIPFSRIKDLKLLKEKIESGSKFNFKGFYTHAGHSYKCRSKDEIISLSTPIIEGLERIKQEFQAPICFGDTPSCSVLKNFSPVDQISPGNFVFYDWTQCNVSSCSIDDVAIAMRCPVVAKYEERNELLIHGGAVHFSKDSYSDNKGIPYFGVLVETQANGWGKQIEGAILKSISQEHGIVSMPEKLMNSTSVGDFVTILPIHSCLTADLMASYQTLDGQVLDHMNGHSFI